MIEISGFTLSWLGPTILYVILFIWLKWELRPGYRELDVIPFQLGNLIVHIVFWIYMIIWIIINWNTIGLSKLIKIT